MKFFIDNCLSPKVARALRELGEDVRHLREEMPANTKDVAWIHEAAKNEWVAVTNDTAMSRVPLEVMALVQTGLVVFYMPSKFAQLDLWAQAHKLFKAWPEIRKAAERANPGDAFQINIKSCKVERKQMRA